MLKGVIRIFQKYKKELYLFLKVNLIILVSGTFWLIYTFDRVVFIDENMLRVPRSYRLEINSELSRYVWIKKDNRVYYVMLRDNKDTHEGLKEYFVENNAEKINCVGDWLTLEGPLKQVLITEEEYYIYFVGYNFKDFYSNYYKKYCVL